MSKRKLNLLVTQGLVNGWDDPRMLTIDGMRRRGYTPTSVNNFCAKMGVTRTKTSNRWNVWKTKSERNFLLIALRFFAVLDPLKVEIVNYPTDRSAQLLMDAPFHPSFMEERGMRKIQLTETVFIDRNDFREVDDPSFFGLSVNKKVRLLFAMISRARESRKIRKLESSKVFSAKSIWKVARTSHRKGNCTGRTPSLRRRR